MRTARVDGARNEFLAYTGFARDNHRGARSGHEIDAGLKRAHRRPIADELETRSHRGRERRTGLAPRIGVTTPLFDRTGHDRPKLREIAGLCHVLERAPLDGIDRVVNSALAGDDHERQGRVGSFHTVEQLEPAHAVHSHVANDRIHAQTLDNPQGLSGVGGELAFMSLAREEHPEPIPHLRIVVHDEDARSESDCGASHGARNVTIARRFAAVFLAICASDPRLPGPGARGPTSSAQPISTPVGDTVESCSEKDEPS